jgi:hypothetical protein
MFRRTLLAALGALLVATPLAAQRRTDPDPRATELLARAESLTRELAAGDSLRRAVAVAWHRGYVLRAGRLVAVLWEAVAPEVGQGVVARADSMFESFGGSTAAWLDHIVAMQGHSTDTARLLAEPAMRRRVPVELDWPLVGEDTINSAITIAGQIGARYRATLDTTWRAWLPREFGVVWVKPAGDWALEALTKPQWSTGSGCLSGRLEDCRLWLGLDRTARPMAMRYRADELRKRMRGMPWYRTSNPDRDACLVSLEDAGCVRFAESNPVVNPIPAPEISRASLVRALWALHGPAAVSHAFVDVEGSIGDRFARAAGISEDSLVAEWRTWTLARGRPERLAASLPQSLAVIFAALLVVFLAARSGRWR